MFEHMLRRHSVLFVYVGGESPLKVSFVHVGWTHVGSLRATRVPAVRLIESAALLASVSQQSCFATLSISAFLPIWIWKSLLFPQEKYSDVASELIVYSYFFSASEQVFPEASLKMCSFSYEHWAELVVPFLRK